MPIPIQNVKPNVVATITPSQPNVVANLTPSSPTVAGVLNNPISTPQSGVLKMVQNTTPTPTLDPALMQRVQATNGTLNANKNFINAVYKAYLGVDAPQNILDQYYGKTVDEVRTGIGGSAPSNKTGFNTDIKAPVDVSNIKSNDFEYPDYADMLSDPTAFMGSYTKLYDTLNKPTDEITGLEKTSTNIEKTIMNLTKAQLGKSGKTLELEEKYGTAGLKLKVNEITNRINQKVAEYNLINEKLSQGTGLTSVIQGKQALAKRMLAAETAVLSAENAVYQGQLDTANDLITRALDLEFGDMEARIEAAKTFYDLNKDKMDSAEKKQSERNSKILDAYSSLLEEQKTDRSENLKLMLEVAKNGGDTSAIDMTKSPSENYANPKVISALQTSTALTTAQKSAAINSIVSSFDNEQIVKNYNTATEGYQTIKTLGTEESDPAIDIAFIYAFAKIMDPNSVVREGEYATVQKYAQSWADAFGFKAQRIYSNTNFLSKDAKDKMLNVLGTKVGSITTQYNNLFKEYQRRIDEVGKGGYNSLQDYSNAFQTDQYLDSGGVSDEAIDNYLNGLQSFNNVGGDTNIAIGQGTLAEANNNPGNLRFAGQSGATQGQGGFARFPSPQAGYNALVNDILGKQSGQTRTGLNANSTLQDLIYVYAPPSENDSSLYVKQIADWLGVNPNTKIGQINTNQLASAIALKESGTRIG